MELCYWKNTMNVSVRDLENSEYFKYFSWSINMNPFQVSIAKL